MEMTGIKPVIINCALGGWYPVGSERLEKSLSFNGYSGDAIYWRNELPPDCPPHEHNPYAFKIYAFKEAIRRGYKIICWLDCSFWAVQNPMPIFDIINEKGIFAFRSGYNCAQTAPDNLLSYVGITRDEAEQIPETATGIVGLNMDNPNAKKVFEYWSEFCDAGLFVNSRNYNPSESLDSRYLHGRQDQINFSMAMHKAGVDFLYEDYVAYYNGGNPGMDAKKCIFFIGGIG